MKHAVFVGALILVSRFASGQSADAGQVASLSSIRSTSSLVIVPTLVRSASGEILTNLSAGDFRLTDNGIEQTVLADEVKGEPIAIVVVMQTGAGAPRQFQNYRTLNTVLTAMMGAVDHRVALVTFDSHLQQIWNFPPRVDGLKHAFKNPEDGDNGAAILDALNGGIGLLEHQPASFRRVILLLSQARDDGSKTSPEQVLRRLAESNTTIYSVTFAQEKRLLQQRLADRRIGAVHGSASLEAALKAMREDTAAEVAALSGGEHAMLKNKDDLERTLSILANDFANSYTLSFHPSAKDGEKDVGFHSIQVQLVKKLARSSVEARMIYSKSGADAED